jgi:hypothetical protein
MYLQLLSLLVAIIVYIACPSTAAAQLRETPLRTFTAQFAPVLSLQADNGYALPLHAGLMAGVGYRFSKEFSILGSFTYMVSTYDSIALRTANSTQWLDPGTTFSKQSDVPYRQFQICADIRYRFNDIQRDPSFYLLAGAAFFNQERSDIHIQAKSEIHLPAASISGIGMMAGLGLEYPIRKDMLGAFAEFRYARRFSSSGDQDIFAQKTLLQIRAGAYCNL